MAWHGVTWRGVGWRGVAWGDVACALTITAVGLGVGAVLRMPDLRLDTGFGGGEDVVRPRIAHVLGLAADAVQVAAASDVPPRTARVIAAICSGMRRLRFWKRSAPAQCRWQQAAELRVAKRLALQVRVLVEVAARVFRQLERVIRGFVERVPALPPRWRARWRARRRRRTRRQGRAWWWWQARRWQGCRRVRGLRQRQGWWLRRWQRWRGWL